MKSSIFKIPALLLLLSLLFMACDKKEETSSTTPSIKSPSQMELLTSSPWFHTKFEKNKDVLPLTKIIEVVFESNGNFFQEKDSNGQWVTNGDWDFVSADSSEVVIFKGMADELTYKVIELTADKMVLTYSENGDGYSLTLSHTPPTIEPDNSKFGLLTAHDWLNKTIYLNGNLITDNGKDPHQFASDGTYKEGKETDGSWKRVDTWAYANNDSTAIKVFVGKANEQLWSITEVTKTSLRVTYNATSGQFKFELEPI